MFNFNIGNEGQHHPSAKKMFRDNVNQLFEMTIQHFEMLAPESFLSKGTDCITWKKNSGMCFVKCQIGPKKKFETESDNFFWFIFVVPFPWLKQLSSKGLWLSMLGLGFEPATFQLDAFNLRCQRSGTSVYKLKSLVTLQRLPSSLY